MNKEDEDTQPHVITKTLRIYKRPKQTNHAVKFLERAAFYMMIGTIACSIWIITIAIFEIVKKFGE